MDYVNLGSTGLKVSRLCLGTMSYGSSRWRSWVLDEEQSFPFIKRALDLGINFFDTADVYSLGLSEAVLGRALKKIGIARERFVVATKVFNPMGEDPNQRGLSRKHIRHAIDESLRRLGVDYIDLYQIHRFDSETPIEETLQALDDLVSAGKVLYLGASSMAAWQFARMLHCADRLGLHRFVTMQNYYNLLHREEEREMNPLCRHEGIGLLAWSPLASGVLAREYRSATTERLRTDDHTSHYYRNLGAGDIAVLEALTGVARARGVPQAQVALAWLLQQPGIVAPIIGATKMNHLDDAVAALQLKLEVSEVRLLTEKHVAGPSTS
jgi:aryl-alcohol dehydrogenase (NADP+)